MGYVVINREIAESVGITSVYKTIGYGGQTYIDSPEGRFLAYCDNPYGFGGRNKRRFKVYSHNQTIDLVA